MANKSYPINYFISFPKTQIHQSITTIATTTTTTTTTTTSQGHTIPRLELDGSKQHLAGKARARLKLVEVVENLFATMEESKQLLEAQILATVVTGRFLFAAELSRLFYCWYLVYFFSIDINSTGIKILNLPLIFNDEQHNSNIELSKL